MIEDELVLKPYAAPPSRCPGCGKRTAPGDTPFALHYQRPRVEVRIEWRFGFFPKRVETARPAHYLCRCVWCGYEYRMELPPGLDPAAREDALRALPEELKAVEHVIEE